MSTPRWGAPSAAAESSGPSKSGLATLAEKLSGQAPGTAPVPPVAPAKPPARVDKVKLDGLVLLKIIKHCTESLPELCSGSLLGMDVDNKLEVTNCFPFPEAPAAPPPKTDFRGRKMGPTKEEEEALEAEKAEGAKYQFDMLKLLRDINVDCNPVGWYRSTYMGSFCTADLVNQLFQYQEQLDNASVQKSVVLVYDPFQTKRGNLSIKAYRLSEPFVKFMRDLQRSSSKKKGGPVKLSPAVVAAVGGLKNDGSAVVATVNETDLSAEDMFDEVPVEITNAHLFTVLIEDLKERNGERLDVDFDRLNLSTNPYLEKNFEFLVEEVDTLAQEANARYRASRRMQHVEQDQIKWIQQRRAENEARAERGDPLLPADADPNNPIFKPPSQTFSTLEPLLIRKQIGIYCDQVNKFTGSGFSKLYLSNAVQQGHSDSASA